MLGFFPARMPAATRRMDHLAESELVREGGIDRLDTRQRVDIAADIVETVYTKPASGRPDRSSIAET
jgi:hypothetical protein